VLPLARVKHGIANFRGKDKIHPSILPLYCLYFKKSELALEKRGRKEDTSKRLPAQSCVLGNILLFYLSGPGLVF